MSCRDELAEIDPFDEGAFCRSRFWLFLSYVVACSSIVLGVWVLLHFYAWNDAVSDLWPGVAVLFQVCPQQSLLCSHVTSSVADLLACPGYKHPR